MFDTLVYCLFVYKNKNTVDVLFWTYDVERLEPKKSSSALIIYKTRMHSSRMRTTRSSSHWGGASPVPPNFPLGCGPGPDPPQLPPWLWTWTRSSSTSPLVVGLETPQDQTPPQDQAPLDQAPPQTRHPPGTRHPPVDRILDTRFWKYYLAPNFVCGR